MLKQGCGRWFCRNWHTVISTICEIAMLATIIVGIRQLSYTHNTLEQMRVDAQIASDAATFNDLKELNYLFVTNSFGIIENVVFDDDVQKTLLNIMYEKDVQIPAYLSRPIFLLFQQDLPQLTISDIFDCQSKSQGHKCSDANSCTLVADGFFRLTHFGRALLREKTISYLNLIDLMLASRKKLGNNSSIFDAHMTTFNRLKQPLRKLLCTMEWDGQQYPNISHFIEEH